MDLFLLHSWPKKDKKHYVLIVPILNQNSSFLLDTDSFSFTILKRLYHTSFKLNNVNFSRALPNGNPFNQLRGSQCAQTPSCILFPNSCKMQNFFPSWLMSCFVHQDFSVEVSNQKQKLWQHPNNSWENIHIKVWYQLFWNHIFSS